jgi:hypothetical protein
VITCLSIVFTKVVSDSNRTPKKNTAQEATDYHNFQQEKNLKNRVMSVAKIHGHP